MTKLALVFAKKPFSRLSVSVHPSMVAPAQESSVTPFPPGSTVGVPGVPFCVSTQLVKERLLAPLPKIPWTVESVIVILDKDEPSEPPPYSIPFVIELANVMPAPSISTLSVIMGKAVAERSIVPATEKTILSAPGVVLAATIASAKEQLPSQTPSFVLAKVFTVKVAA